MDILFKGIHYKLKKSIEQMLLDTYLSLPYYGYFALNINFYEATISTCAVNITSEGMCFYYNKSFLENLNQNEVNFVMVHEIYHLLWRHYQRTKETGYDHKISNIAQDMIINHLILKDINSVYIQEPKGIDNTINIIRLPDIYDGKLIYEDLYKWLLSNDIDIDGNLNNNGESLDVHLDDEVSEEEADSIIAKNINNAKNNCELRGIDTKNVERTILKLEKKRENYLKYILKCISNNCFGNKKSKTLNRPNRKGISGLKGKKKQKDIINCILDTSGSMDSMIEKILSYIYRSDIDINLIQIDTIVQSINSIKNPKQLENLKIKGNGGTILQPSINYIVENYNMYNTVILTDGYTDSLNISNIKKNILIISFGKKINIIKSNNKIKQILINKS